MRGRRDSPQSCSSSRGRGTTPLTEPYLRPSSAHQSMFIPSQIIAAVRIEGLLGLSELVFPAAASRESFVVGAVCTVRACVFIAAAGQCANFGHRGVLHQHV